MLAFDRRSLRHRACRLGGARRRRRGCGLKVAHVATGGERECRAQQRRRSPRAAVRPLPSRTLCHRCHSYVSRALVPAQQFDLPHPERLYPRPAMRLDPATDPNSTTFKRLQHDPGGFKRRQPCFGIVTAKSRVQFRPKFR